jgi:nitrogen fixation NifU-like protein
VVVDDVSYASQGCAISRASASVLHELVVGQALDQVATTHQAMRAMLTSRGADPGSEDVLGDGVALAGVAKYPARVKCALLSWMALTDALAQAAVPAPGSADVPDPTAGPATAPPVAVKESAR